MAEFTALCIAVSKNGNVSSNYIGSDFHSGKPCLTGKTNRPCDEHWTSSTYLYFYSCDQLFKMSQYNAMYMRGFAILCWQKYWHCFKLS